MATNAEMQTPAWLIATLKNLFDRYHAIAMVHSTNNGLLVAQDRAANAIGNADVRAKIKAAIQSDVRRQGLIAGALRTMYGSLVNARNTVAGALRLVGVDASPIATLAGLGFGPALPLVPIAIGAGLLLLGITAAALWSGVNLQRKTLEGNTRIIDRVLAGQMSVADGVALINGNAKAADDSKDLLGLKGLAKAFTPIVGMIVAAMVIPPLLNALTPMLSRRRAA